MIAVDTNVVVRLLTNDDHDEARRAAAVFEANEILLSRTILLETEWVLRFSYEAGRHEIHRGLAAVLGMPRVVVEAPRQVSLALEWFRHGLDFADALHLASAADAERFVTFDRKLARRSDSLAAVPVETL
ncbi:MAG: type II toxin-antitoxin system VapC family toxin [Burkholderiaceae bacterium]|nr:type II toxin-antitoxin system VapC family toxin [Burkholderiaceae bacterium]